jgi:predicted ABC-type transport system involved in lysophospholipase L1 biosynthesis ATPase subunit
VAPDGAPLLAAEGLAKGFGSGAGRVDVFRNVSLEVRAGDLLAITGPSGCGKSTLLHLFAGLDTPDAGAVRVSGTDWGALSPEARAALRGTTIGFVFQFHHLLPELTAEENVALPLFLAGGSEADGRKEAREVLDRVGLSARASALPRTLSGGERQRSPSRGRSSGGPASSSATSRREASTPPTRRPFSTSSRRSRKSERGPRSSSPTIRNGRVAVLASNRWEQRA